ncbi:alpha/beta hydrolase [Spiractinospora alimapuensis]|uniref:alpha/beta fold hydrolase n=1 Tax=Spiractinospora alimapuensis TaxID=2820884 RepID=UPI001F3BCE6F|nr:alpha/beta hydrolase [Spiractinospora alimapuensis]QVQ51221.1 alpha/beta hydrolase [Spiractinospora alimapuensis]
MAIDSSGADRSTTIEVPGAHLYYEARGAGPLLLLIPGGPQDAGVFTDLAGELAHSYTVVSYDPRGNSRSPLTGEWTDQDVDLHADDAARLITAVGMGPAHVLGTSGGGQIGLSLAARHPESVRSLLAHEPACALMLDDPSEALAADHAVYDTYLRHGVDAAMAKFFRDNALDDPDSGETATATATEGEEEGEQEPDALSAEDVATFERIAGNFEYFLAHGLLPLSTYQPDVARLRNGPVPVVVGLGEDSQGQLIDEIGRALAAALDVTPVIFPGDHVGYGPHAAEFARVVERVLAESTHPA